jgi:hypothetical protein
MTAEAADELLRKLRALAAAGGVLLLSKENVRATLTEVQVDHDTKNVENVVWKLYLDFEPHKEFNRQTKLPDCNQYVGPLDFDQRFLVVRKRMVMERTGFAVQAYRKAVRTGQTKLPYEIWLEQTVGDMERRMMPALPSNKLVH